MSYSPLLWMSRSRLPSTRLSKRVTKHGTFKQDRTDPELLSAKRLEAVEAFARAKGKELVRYSRTLFWGADKTFRVCCAASKRYEGDLCSAKTSSGSGMHKSQCKIPRFFLCPFGRSGQSPPSVRI